MKILSETSLAETVDNLNEAVFYGKKVSDSKVAEAAEWMAGRQGMPGCYAGMFAPTRKDFQEGARLFTGEKIVSQAGLSHVLGQETCRLLIQLNVNTVQVKTALEPASSGILARLEISEGKHQPFGMYCCGTCTPALWRHLVVGGLEKQEKRLEAGIKELKRHRDEKGKWHRFPFWWTLLALSEMKFATALDEILYVAPTLERYVKRNPRNDRYAMRKHALAGRVLAVL